MLASDLANLASEAQRIVAAGADYLHLDIMDGQFVPNITWGPPVVECMRKHVKDVFFDCHMMVQHPEQWVEPIAKAGGSQYTFHIEAVESNRASCSDDEEMSSGMKKSVTSLCNLIRSHDMKVGVAISPDTPVSALRDFVSLVDMVLIMTVRPGFGGQSFMPNMMPKVLELRTAHPALDIGVDGGLGPNTIEKAAKAGANMIVAGSACFKPGDLTSNAVITILRRCVEKHGNGMAEHEMSKMPSLRDSGPP